MQKDYEPKNKYVEMLQAFLEYLRRPKTVFDLKDRSKLLVILIVVVWALRQLVQMLFTNTR